MGNVRVLGESRSDMKFAQWSVHTAVFLALTGVILAGGTSSGATTASQSAPTTASCPTTSNGTVCISQISDDYTATTITLTMTVGQATNPTTDTNWNNSSTVIKWALFTDGSSTQSYSATESDPASGQFSGAVTTSPANTAGCSASTGVTATFSTTANTYGMSFPSSCVGSPTSLTIEASWSYASGETTYTAALPSTGQAPCCSVTPDPATTTTTSTTTTSTTASTTTTTTVPSTSAGATTTTTTSVAAVVSSPSSIGNTGSGSSGLATTGVGGDTPLLIVFGVGMIAIGCFGRRRLMSLARRAKRSRVR